MASYAPVPRPYNEPVRQYGPGSPERERLEVELQRQSVERPLPMTIGGVQRTGAGAPIIVTQPHSHSSQLGFAHEATETDALHAIDAALQAASAWRDLPLEDRAAVFLKAADLLAGPWRERLVASTMLGQSKTAIQAEIDAACELIDFWRFNVAFAEAISAEQPISSPGVWNRVDARPLEGFVYAVTPFNFTAIAGNLPTAPALMGNTVVWKPSSTQLHAATMTMDLLREAGLPDGVINLVTGHGSAISSAVLPHPALAGVHFTGSTPVFQSMWRTIGDNIAQYDSYPRLVGETGGKDFVLAHPSADIDVLRVALIRGAFEYQGQKCSAASRAYIPASLWTRLKDDLASEVDSLTQGDVRDLSNFMGAVIDKRAFTRLAEVIDAAHADDDLTVIAGGTSNDATGWFIRPTVLVSTNPDHEVFRTEYFGPVLAIYVYDDENFATVARTIERVTPYALTGSIIAQDRRAIAWATRELRFAAGNFYINDKPTGAVVGQQPFGGGRASGTNDKAGSAQNLLRWTSTRSIKETFDPPSAVSYPHMG
ncbi:MAG: L-glutamate gamma-semialdehyde dehydrogenase [Actinobacteria bacterium]|nr:L-glutamate gamma-semialdehyde dehydrogenase [Actinomycetota bacterium]